MKRFLIIGLIMGLCTIPILAAPFNDVKKTQPQNFYSDGTSLVLTLDIDGSIYYGAYFSFNGYLYGDADNPLTLGKAATCASYNESDDVCVGEDLEVRSKLFVVSDTYLGGLLQVAGNLQLVNGGTLNSSSNGNITIDGNGTALLIINDGIRFAADDFDGASEDIDATDYIIHVTRTASGTAVVGLPAAQCTNGRLLIIKDAAGNAGSNNITVKPLSGTIDGAATAPISTNYGAMDIYCYSSNWFIK